MSDRDSTSSPLDGSKRVASAGADAVRVGVDSATEIAEIGLSVVEELMAGFETAARRGVGMVSDSVDTVKRTAAKGSGDDRESADGSADDAAATDRSIVIPTDQLSDLIGQAVDLAEHALKIATDAAGRLLEVGLGPAERLVDPASPRRTDEARIELGTVAPGRRATGEFQLQNSADHDVEIVLDMVNPLAGMRGTIGVEHVAFEPKRATVPSNGDCSVRITVEAPPSAPKGRYLGIVRADSVPELALVVGLDVA